MNKKIKPTTKQLTEALERIAQMGDGIRADLIDWHNIGKNAKAVAKEVLRPKCKECGR